MTVNGPEGVLEWDAVDWRACERNARRLRQRIFKAVREQDWPKVRNLQKLMLRSRSNTLVSVRQVTQRNAGRKTAGIDGEVALTPGARAEVAVRVHQSRSSWRPRPVRRVHIPKATDRAKLRPLGIPVIMDRCHQARVRNALEPEWEARFEPRSYGFRPGRGCQDAIAAIYNVCKGPWSMRTWVLDADLAAAFDRIDHDHLLATLGSFPARDLIRSWLKAGVFEAGKGFTPTGEGTPQGGVMTPPTQWRTLSGLLIVVTVCSFRGRAGGAAAGGDAVADDDALGADEDVFDDQAQDALLLGEGRGAGVAAEPGEEAFEVVGELEVGVAVGELGGQGVELAAQAGLAGAQLGHALTQFVEGDQLFLVGLDQPGDRGRGLGQCLLQALLAGGGGVGGAQLLQPPVDLGPDQLRAGEQAGDVVPHDLVEVVGADRLVVADAAVFVAVVVEPRHR